MSTMFRTIIFSFVLLLFSFSISEARFATGVQDQCIKIVDGEKVGKCVCQGLFLDDEFGEYMIPGSQYCNREVIAAEDEMNCSRVEECLWPLIGGEEEVPVTVNGGKVTEVMFTW